MKAKRIIQRNLPLDRKYTLLDVSYLSIENGGGCSCSNCGRLITNVATIKNDEGDVFSVGLDCMDTLLSENLAMLNFTDYQEYEYKKHHINKAKQLRVKLNKLSKKHSDFKYTLSTFEDSFGFNFYNGDNPIGWDYSFELEFKDLTLDIIEYAD